MLALAACAPKPTPVAPPNDAPTASCIWHGSLPQAPRLQVGSGPDEGVFLRPAEGYRVTVALPAGEPLGDAIVQISKDGFSLSGRSLLRDVSLFAMSSESFGPFVEVAPGARLFPIAAHEGSVTVMVPLPAGIEAPAPVSGRLPCDRLTLMPRSGAMASSQAEDDRGFTAVASSLELAAAPGERTRLALRIDGSRLARIGPSQGAFTRIALEERGVRVSGWVASTNLAPIDHPVFPPKERVTVAPAPPARGAAQWSCACAREVHLLAVHAGVRAHEIGTVAPGTTLFIGLRDEAHWEWADTPWSLVVAEARVALEIAGEEARGSDCRCVAMAPR